MDAGRQKCFIASIWYFFREVCGPPYENGLKSILVGVYVGHIFFSFQKKKFPINYPVQRKKIYYLENNPFAGLSILATYNMKGGKKFFWCDTMIFVRNLPGIPLKILPLKEGWKFTVDLSGLE